MATIPHDAREVLEYWFGESSDDLEINRQKSDLWWGHGEATDREIRERFGALLERGAAGELDEWAHTPVGRLALIVLLDQFSRNVYRDTPGMFAQDEKALALCLEGMEREHDRVLRPIERVFFYLPMEHAEDLDLQERCVATMRELADEVPEAWRETFETFVDFAERHRVIIERFGRFPHRNAILGRESTDEERAFLEQPGSSF